MVSFLSLSLTQGGVIVHVPHINGDLAKFNTAFSAFLLGAYNGTGFGIGFGYEVSLSRPSYHPKTHALVTCRPVRPSACSPAGAAAAATGPAGPGGAVRQRGLAGAGEVPDDSEARRAIRRHQDCQRSLGGPEGRQLHLPHAGASSDSAVVGLPDVAWIQLWCVCVCWAVSRTEQLPGCDRQVPPNERRRVHLVERWDPDGQRQHVPPEGVARVGGGTADGMMRMKY
jgi:hypothetical protein